MDDTTVTISIDEYDTLQMCASVLLALQNEGVDNWEGFKSAMATLLEVAPTE